MASPPPWTSWRRGRRTPPLLLGKLPEDLDLESTRLLKFASSNAATGPSRPRRPRSTLGSRWQARADVGRSKLIPEQRALSKIFALARTRSRIWTSPVPMFVQSTVPENTNIVAPSRLLHNSSPAWTLVSSAARAATSNCASVRPSSSPARGRAAARRCRAAAAAATHRRAAAASTATRRRRAAPRRPRRGARAQQRRRLLHFPRADDERRLADVARPVRARRARGRRAAAAAAAPAAPARRARALGERSAMARCCAASARRAAAAAAPRRRRRRRRRLAPGGARLLRGSALLRRARGAAHVQSRGDRSSSCRTGRSMRRSMRALPQIKVSSVY